MSEPKGMDLAAGLAGTRLFAALSTQGRARLAARGTEVALPGGVQIFAQGDAGDGLYLIIEGEVEISMSTPSGKHVLLARHGAGAVIGEMAVLDGLPRSADAATTRRTRMMRFGRAAVLEALKAEPEALVALLADLAGRLRRANSALEATVALDLRAKVARFLLEESAGGAKRVQLTQVEMARRLGASREKVNRRLHAWRAAGVIVMDKTGVRIVRTGPLAEAVEDAMGAAGEERLRD